MKSESPTAVLVDAVESVRHKEDTEEKLDELKRSAKEWRERDDMIWNRLMASHATLGNSRGGSLVAESENYERVRFEVLQEMAEELREEHIRETLLDADVSYHNVKTERILKNIGTVEDMGGPIAAKREYENLSGQADKMAFFKQFNGIGDKYARNIPMDVRDPDFRNTIALDDRIRGISEELGVEFDGYEEHEGFYRSAADEIGLSGWELDRILYQFEDEVHSEIEARNSR